ncbi:DNA polymerase III subunit epsilon [Neiella marina]|uniref:DNA polymerase III subunit epsilon n=1 Tax=Neiella marina TaxID=508461 RepID=A0A8J2U5H9_9GAMM|nr:exonuclease domain-containing protein [Neiella marina]GGA79533.1 DNA polymerase III subunit epsilon [Neiella marina]
MWFQFRLQRQIAKARRALHKAPNPSVSDYLDALPKVDDQPLSLSNILALDLELTGLDPKRHQIVSVGHVAVDNLAISLGSAQQHLIQVDGSVGDSAVIHHLTDADLASARPLCDAMDDLLQALCGRMLLCHHAPLDTAFLQQAFIACFGTRLPLLVIDTQQIEKRRQERTAPNVPLHRLRLHHCRQHYELPLSSGHQALGDAIACAELLMAQQAHQTSVSRLNDVVQLA